MRFRDVADSTSQHVAVGVEFGDSDSEKRLTLLSKSLVYSSIVNLSEESKMAPVLPVDIICK